jgi:hypothetical protein
MASLSQAKGNGGYVTDHLVKIVLIVAIVAVVCRGIVRWMQSFLVGVGRDAIREARREK